MSQAQEPIATERQAPAGARQAPPTMPAPSSRPKPPQATKPGRRIEGRPKTGPESAFPRPPLHRQGRGGGGVPDAPEQGRQKPFLALHRPSYGPACPALPPAAYRPPAGAETWPARTRCHAARPDAAQAGAWPQCRPSWPPRPRLAHASLRRDSRRKQFRAKMLRPRSKLEVER
jgi:hypothetical protein